MIRDLLFRLQTNETCLTETNDGYQCMVDAYTRSAGGQELFTLLVGGILLLAFYIGSDYHPAPVAVGTMLLGGLFVPVLPAQYASMGLTVMLLGFILGVWAIIRTFFLEVGR